jgi:hypothetical protein
VQVERAAVERIVRQRDRALHAGDAVGAQRVADGPRGTRLRRRVDHVEAEARLARDVAVEPEAVADAEVRLRARAVGAARRTHHPLLRQRADGRHGTLGRRGLRGGQPREQRPPVGPGRLALHAAENEDHEQCGAENGADQGVSHGSLPRLNAGGL